MSYVLSFLQNQEALDAVCHTCSFGQVCFYTGVIPEESGSIIILYLKSFCTVSLCQIMKHNIMSNCWMSRWHLNRSDPHCCFLQPMVRSHLLIDPDCHHTSVLNGVKERGHLTQVNPEPFPSKKKILRITVRSHKHVACHSVNIQPS